MNPPLLLKADQLQKIYFKGGTPLPVLQGISLEIHANDRIALTGPSGAGKSTLLHVLGTLDNPTAGALWDGQGRNLARLSEKDLSAYRNRQLGFVFQFHYLLPEFSSLENVMLPGLIAGESRRDMRQKAAYLLDLVGLSARLHHRPQELSGGEQQRVAIARAIILNPPLLLADEPTGNLDSTHRDQLLSLLLDLADAHHTALLLITHDPEVASCMRTQWVMQDGQLVAH